MNLAYSSRYGHTALHRVCANGCEKVCRLILQKEGAPINASTTNGGRTPLDWAISNNQNEIVEFLLQNKAIANRHTKKRRWKMGKELVL